MDLASVYARPLPDGSHALSLDRHHRRIYLRDGDCLQEGMVPRDRARLRAAGRSGVRRHFSYFRASLPWHRDSIGQPDLRCPPRFIARVSLRAYPCDTEFSAGHCRSNRRNHAVLLAAICAGVLRRSLYFHQRLRTYRHWHQPDYRCRCRAQPGARFRFHRERRAYGRSEIYGVVRRIWAHGHAGLVVPGNPEAAYQASWSRLTQHSSAAGAISRIQTQSHPTLNPAMPLDGEIDNAGSVVQISRTLADRGFEASEIRGDV